MNIHFQRFTRNYSLLSILLCALFLSGCASGLTVKNFPNIPPDAETGYVKFTALAGGAGGSGFSSLGDQKVYLQGKFIGKLFQPQYPFHSSQMYLLQPYLVVKVPVGLHNFYFTQGFDWANTHTDLDNASRFVPVEKDKVTLVLLSNEIISSTVVSRNFLTGTATNLIRYKSMAAWYPKEKLPIPSSGFGVEPSINCFDTYIKLLNDPIWQIRLYASTRLRFLKDQRSLPYLEKALLSEKHELTKKAIQDAINTSK